MKRYLVTMLLVVLIARSVSLAQKEPSPSPPPSPPSGNSGSTTSFPVSNPPVDYNGLQRLMDEERMNTPEPATKPVTITEIEKTLADNRHSGDGKLAAILTKLSLTERANAPRLSRWNSENSGPQTRQILMALADGSAFLPLPAEDIPAAPAPSMAEQRRMMTAFAKFLGETLPGLPNFRATRLTTYFVDSPPRQLSLATDPAAPDPLRNRPMHVVDTSRLEVTYAEGREAKERSTGFEVANHDPSRFTTAGEFGPILYGMMMDALQSKLVWAGWESSPDGPLAVFRFDASKEKSHYSMKPPGDAKPQNHFVAYRGEIAIHPSNGTIERLSVVASPTPDDAVAEADIAVEYGRVEIGNRFYTCPVHGVALSKTPLSGARGKKQDQPLPLQTQLNDVSFQQYHVFRGELHITREGTRQP
jgi:hypothetical protein